MLSYLPSAAAAVIGLSSFALGHTLGYATFGAGVALGCFCIIGFWSHVTSKTTATRERKTERSKPAPVRTAAPPPRRKPVQSSANPVERLIAEGRTALALRTNFIGELSESELVTVRGAFAEEMAFIHAGRVRIDSWSCVAEQADGAAKLELVEAFWMDRTPVTNSQFAAFVRAGGYKQDSPWWPEEARPLISQFVDETGSPGPSGWRNGAPPKEEADHPVVGVSWYEAAAFASWCGKRLPTDPEWLKAATWPIDASGTLTQRTYPWGNQLHSRHARLWNEAGDGAVDVMQYVDGENPCGVRQLIGNVWEWMHGAFGDWDDTLPFPTDSSLAAIRGGAYDTYFQSQATAQFFSAEPRANRRSNIGFRCVVHASDVDVEMTYRREHLELGAASSGWSRVDANGDHDIVSSA